MIGNFIDLAWSTFVQAAIGIALSVSIAASYIH
jgi:hypothetical protein